MVNARVTAYGAVVAAGLALLSPSGSACDNRYTQACGPKASTAVETNQATKVAKGTVRSAKRKAVRATRSAANARRKLAWTKQEDASRKTAVRVRHAKWSSAKDRRRSARVVVQQRRKSMSLAASSQSSTRESAIERRFRGFIAPVSMSVNVFEVMRKPRLDGSHLVPTAAVGDIAMVAPSMDGATSVAGAQSAAAAQSAEPETVGSAEYQLAAAGSVVVSEPPASSAPIQVVESAKPAEKPSDSLPIRELFLALCGALTAASALRFVVGA